eukprot:TRINITY_DN22603_c0_g4_i1.p1 TRINITY_DN22603_c0_g4~~TRINITY_DN22603_c0_g4_i1.p1  ORF type:complete len:785 (+),score=92.12 TRINITY_DN22603_c0_g4_i1:254-2356(+)
MDSNARAWCDRRSWCVGYMRYIANEPQEHCHLWCGRPQFCREVSPTQNDEWISYIQKGPLQDFQEQRSTMAYANDEDDTTLGMLTPREIVCDRPYLGMVKIWEDEPPEYYTEEPSSDHCRVLHHSKGAPIPRDWLSRNLPGSQQPFFNGILSDAEEIVPYFAASTTKEPWAYHFEHNSYDGETLNGGNTLLGPKRHFLSIFFTSVDASCDGKNKSQWTPHEAEMALPGHTYVADGSLERRREAFNDYHFTVICMAPGDNTLVPQAAIDALGFATHPLVPRAVHEQLHRAFFHLPDAIQPYTRIHPIILEAYLEDLYTNPEKNEAMYYKQTFLFLMMELFRYRYRQSYQKRLQTAACAMCTELYRVKRRLADATEETPDESRHSDMSRVGTAFCVMSRRSGDALRVAIRETWATFLGVDSILRFFVGMDLDDDKTAVTDLEAGDVVELNAPETYKAVTLKAFAMLHWARETFPNLRYLVRSDDDVYLRPGPLLSQLQRRPAVAYLWGNFDSGSSIVRDPQHPHYNSFEQMPQRKHPMFSDIFPPYVRGHLWAMSSDLLTLVIDAWIAELASAGGEVSLELAGRLPHPDDPALGVAMSNIVDSGALSLALDDRDLNHFALNPSCDATYLNIHERTWVVHHVTPHAMRCFWGLDRSAAEASADASKLDNPHPLPDLCPCSLKVVEEKSVDDDEFDYPRDRFNE